MKKFITIISLVLSIHSIAQSPDKTRGSLQSLYSNGNAIQQSTPIQVSIDWTMNPRFFTTHFNDGTPVVVGYNRTTHKYVNEYVNPSGYGITLKAVLYNAPTNLTNISYRWEITGINRDNGGTNSFTYSITTEKILLNSSVTPVPGTVLIPPANSQSIPALPYLGLYKIKVTVLQGNTNTRTITELGSIQQMITLKDYLIVALGDSFTSGEGNPDVYGISDDDFWCEHIKLGQTTNLVFGSEFDMQKKAVWLEPLGHRSFISASAQMAKMLEDADPHTSVTFLNFGNSGAKITEGLFTPQHRDWQTKGQIDDAKQTVNNRKIDAVIMSIGINDLGGSFGGISKLVEEASNPLPPEFFESPKVTEALKQVDRLPVLYAQANDEIKTKLNPQSTFIYEIPVNIFRNVNGKIEKPCGALSYIDLEDAIIIDCIASELNLQEQLAAKNFGWTYIGGIVNAFRGHGYCESSDNSWYRAASTSCKIQGDINGTIHPNEKGHHKIAELGFSVVKNAVEQKNEVVVQPRTQFQ